MSIRIQVCLLFLLVFEAAACTAAPADAPPIVPQPQQLEARAGAFEMVAQSRIVVSEDDEAALRPHAEVLVEAIRRLAQIEPTIRVGVAPRQGDIVLELDGPEQEGAYDLEAAAIVRIRAGSLAGIAHGSATLLQAMGASDGRALGRFTAQDYPDASYRSLLVDLGRNPHSLQSLKQAVDWMWLYKLNYLHLHLTDDQRFAFPSSAYPKLNERTPDFTVEELRELDRYAAARGVSIVPELEAPAHSGVLRRTYPEVFGRTPSDLATLGSAREGLKTLIDEMIEVFQTARYIHIGCDEAYGVPPRPSVT